jgi:glycosyltransferase involved in cell wall biosynthesis
MKLLVVSFPCVTPINQGFFAEVEQATNWNVTIVAPSNWKTDYGETRELERWSEYDGELIPLPVWLPGNIPLHVYRSFFVSLLRRVDPDAIYVHHEAYGLATAQVYFANWLLDKKPIGFYSAQNILKRYPPPFRYFENFVYSDSSFSFPITETVLNVLRGKGYDGPATTLPLGIDASLYRPGAEIPRAVFDASEEEIIIGYVGRIIELKGLSTLLYALDQIRHLPWRLVLVGSGPYESDLWKIARSLNLSERITHLGYVPHPEIPRHLATLDILVLPSETQSDAKEQFGRVIIEALACGTPVIGSDSGEIPNLILTTNGGLIFPERNPASLASRLKTLICNSDQRLDLAEAGRATVLRKYTTSALAKRFASTIESALESALDNSSLQS